MSFRIKKKLHFAQVLQVANAIRHYDNNHEYYVQRMCIDIY